ncbi:MAG TPA: ATP-binding protein, partial [Gemmataceae bacterium]|nr:ATP-binding protein [Gemmataceae bacterium]
GGRIDITAEEKEGKLEFAVRDNGSGIDAVSANRLFQPYFTTKKHGTGLGLFVTRKLVADQGGTIDFQSTPGEGTVFKVCLPLTQTATEQKVGLHEVSSAGFSP